jgi:glycerol-1-phosphate dehydrogenase [NAD(P)+]
MIKAGIGDSLCFYGCWFDWLLSHLILSTKFEKKPFEILEKKMNFFIKNYKKFQLDDEKLLKILMEILLLSGAGMTIAQGSYPASQSEHLISHAFEMKYPKKAHKILHGLQIAITSLTIAKLQESLLEKDFIKLEKSKFPKQELEKFFGKEIANECEKEYIEKINFNIEEINNRLKTDWKRHREVLEKIIFAHKDLKNIFRHFKIADSYKNLGLSSEEYCALTQNAKFIRNRFTCLDLSF